MHLVDRFHKQVELAKRRHAGIEMVLRWTPGHVGIEENERADEAKGDSSAGD